MYAPQILGPLREAIVPFAEDGREAQSLKI